MAHRLIDLTQEIYEGMVLWKGHPPTKIEVHATHESTAALFDPPYSYTAETITLTTHAGTHTDSVSHVDPRPDAPSIEELPLEWFYTEAICIDLSHLPPRTLYSVDDIEQALARHGLEVDRISSVEPGAYGDAAPTTESPEFLVIAHRSA